METKGTYEVSTAGGTIENVAIKCVNPLCRDPIGHYIDLDGVPAVKLRGSSQAAKILHTVCLQCGAEFHFDKPTVSFDRLMSRIAKVESSAIATS